MSDPLNGFFDRAHFLAGRRFLQVVADARNEAVAANGDAESDSVAIKPVDLACKVPHAGIRARPRVNGSSPNVITTNSVSHRRPVCRGRPTADLRRTTGRPGRAPAPPPRPPSTHPGSFSRAARQTGCQTPTRRVRR